MSRNVDGEIVVLLGREQYSSSWKRSCRWSAFEGGRKGGEKVSATAARECSEESLALVNPLPMDIERNYVCRIVLNIIHDDRKSFMRLHTSFVHEVAYDEHLPEAFAQRRARLLLLKQHNEKLDTIMSNAMGAPYVVVRVDVQSRFIVMTSTRGITMTYTSPFSKTALEVLQTCDAIHNMVESKLTETDKACVHVTQCASKRWFAYADADVLEKDEIRWFSMSEIHHWIDRGHNHAHEFLRTFFVPVACALVKLSTQSNLVIDSKQSMQKHDVAL